MFDLYDYAVDKVYENVLGPKTKYSDRMWFRCPFCGDSKNSKSSRRGWLFKSAKTSISYHCYNCGLTLVGYKFLMELENKSYKEIKSELLSNFKDGDFQNVVRKLLNNEHKQINTDDIVERKAKTFDLLSTWENIENHPEVNQIMLDRCIYDAPNRPRGFDLYYDTKYKKIVIPWYRDNNLRYYQYRAIGDYNGPKYLFPKNTEKDIFNFDNIDLSFPYVFLIEGVFDAIWVKNGICVGGATITDHQKEILSMICETHELIFFPDNPFIDTRGKEEILKLFKKNPKQKIFKWDRKCKYKDINEEIIDTGDYDKYMDEDFLVKSITDPVMYKMELCFF